MEDVKIQAILQELEQQRNLAQTRCAQYAGELAERELRIKTLTEQNEKLTEQLKEKEDGESKV